MNRVVLTVADHEQNGFVSLAKWSHLTYAEARAFLDATDASISDEAEPDMATAAFTFILDLMDDNGDLIDTGERLLPTQTAMHLAPDAVRQWLDERPDPDRRHEPVHSRSRPPGPRRELPPMSAPVMKKCCIGCPFDVGMPATEEAYNLGCLPSIAEVHQLCHKNGTAWACHGAPTAVCAGWAEMHPDCTAIPLQHMEGVHP